MGFNLRGDKNSLALLSSKRVKAYSRSRADEAFALPSFSDAMPASTTELPPHKPSTVVKPEHHAERHHHAEHDSKNVKQTMLQHESMFKEQLHELHRLYQKQCILMVESQTGNSCHSRSEPPASNSSLSCNPDSSKPLDDVRLGDARVNRAFDNHGNLCNFPTHIADVKPCLVDMDIKPCLVDTNQHLEQACTRPLLDLERPAEGCQVFDLERLPNDVATFDMEPPAEVYLDAEVGKEKARAMGLSHTLAHASVLSHSDYVKDNGDINITRENRDFVSRNNRDIWGRTISEFGPSYDRGKADNVCKEEVGNKERMRGRYSPPGCFGNHISDPSEDRSPSSHRSKRILPVSCQDSFSYPVESAPSSGRFRGLPDLNGELVLAENQTSLVQRKPEKLINDYHYIDLEADPSPPNGSSKLPHWLVQPPPSSKVAAPAKFPPSTSERQQPLTTLVSSQVHHTSKSPGAYNSIPGMLVNASIFQEPYNSWSHSKASSQEEAFYKQSSSSLTFFPAGNVGAPQKSLHGAHFNRVSDESIPSFLPYPTESGKMGLSTASRMLSSHCAGSIVFDTQAASKELLSSISSREAMTLPPAVLPWYQQQESFSSLMRQASNPEPPFQRESHATAVNHRGAATIHQDLPRNVMNNVENGAYGMHSIGSNFEGPCPVTARIQSPRKERAFDFLSCNIEQTAAIPWKQVERPLYMGHNAEETTLSSSDQGQIPSRNVFDLNVSSDVAPMEENFDSRHFTESSGGINQNLPFKEECDIIRSSGWDTSGVNKTLCMNEQLQGTGFTDMLAEKGMGPEVHIKDASQSLSDSTFSTKPGGLCFPRERLGGHDMCTDNCSGEDEVGASFVEVKSSDASGLTSCESRDAAHLELAKARDDSNTSSGEACQSRESRIPACNKDAAFSLNVQSSSSGGLPLATANESQQWGSFLFSRTESARADIKEDYLGLVCTDESEAANNSIARKHLPEATEIAELLLSMSFELPLVAKGQEAINPQEKSLDWLANVIPQEEDCKEGQGLDVDMAGLALHEGKFSPMNVGEKAMDPFESAVLALKPINPNVECLITQVVERGSLAENGHSLPTLRRRSSRRGRAIKDFQREILGCLTSLSRHEITEDLQFIEGLIKSTTEEINICAFFEEDDNKPSSSPEWGSQKKARGTIKAFRGRKLNGTLNVCSWGESTRRKRMGRRRSQRSCLPPGVGSLPLENTAGDGALALLM